MAPLLIPEHVMGHWIYFSAHQVLIGVSVKMLAHIPFTIVTKMTALLVISRNVMNHHINTSVHQVFMCLGVGTLASPIHYHHNDSAAYKTAFTILLSFSLHR